MCSALDPPEEISGIFPRFGAYRPMTSFLRSDRSTAVSVWLFAVAALVLAMVVVGGGHATDRLGAIDHPMAPCDWFYSPAQRC